MTIYYIDPANGNDSANGLGWGTAWKTMTNGATSARLGLSGAEVRIAKSPDPVSIGSLTWTHDAFHTLTISSLSNALIDNCETAWSAGLVTPTAVSTYNRQGTNSNQAILASINGKVCYKTITSANYSAYSRITFWFNVGASTNYVSSNPFQIWLCSDTLGATPVLKFTLPKYYYPANSWVPITLNVDSGFNWADATAIQSISLNTTASTSATVRFDNFSVAKSSSDSTSLVLTDLIAKNNGDDQYFPIQYIDGTTVCLATPNGLNATAQTTVVNTSKFYSITGTETIDTIKRECFNTALDIPAGSNSISVLTINPGASGTGLNPMTVYKGGYNTSTDTIDGETWFDGATSWGWGLSQQTGYWYNFSVDNINCVRYYVSLGLKFGDTTQITNHSSVNCYQSYNFTVQDVTSTRQYGTTAANISMNWIYTGLGASSPTAIISGTAAWMSVQRPDLRPTFSIKNLFSRFAGFALSFGTGIPFNVISIGTIMSNQTNITNIGIIQVPTLGKVKVNNVLTFATGSFATFGYFNIPKLYGNTSYITYGAHSRVIQITGTIGETVSGVLSTSVSNLVYIADIIGNVLIEGVGSNATFNYPNWFNSYGGSFGNFIFRNIKTNQTLPTGFSSGSMDSYPGIVSFEKYNQTSTNRVYTRTTTASYSNGVQNYWESQTSVVSTGSSAWRKFYVNDASGGYGLPDHLIIATPTFKAGSLVTITLKTRRTSVNVYGYLMVEGGFSNIPDAGVVSKATGSTNTWETLTITFTPTDNIVVPIYMGATCTNTCANQSVYFDDLTINQE